MKSGTGTQFIDGWSGSYLQGYGGFIEGHGGIGFDTSQIEGFGGLKVSGVENGV